MDKVLVTSGKYRGRALKTPGGATHPMGSREKLALFNMLAGDVSGARVLDVFAGSGALGVEALSRGAKEVFFVDNSSEAVRVIKENLAALGISDEAKVVKGSFGDIRGRLGEFDLVLADPPYDDFGNFSLDGLGDLVKKGGLMVLSHPGEAPQLAGFSLVKTRQYASAHISIYDKD